MNASAADIVQALVEMSKTMPAGEKLLREVCDLLKHHLRTGDEALAVTLVTTSGNEAALAAAVTSLVEKKYGRTVELTQRANPSLIGGAVLQIGDEQIDLSLRGSLNDLEMKMRSSPVA
ncbi:hypothetical protein EXS70_03810 [Candidatus Peribacteria bacterium]|nr:hypothetical protein [Candidatus Peribacteria bacterium]